MQADNSNLKNSWGKKKGGGASIEEAWASKCSVQE